MKNVVVEVQRDYAVIMNNMGDFIKIKNRNYKLGQRIESYSKKRNVCFTRLVAATAVVVVMLFGGGAYAYYTPYSYITVDINPSIELEMNIFNRVIAAKAMNEDAKAILDGIKLNGNDINTVMDKLVSELIKEGYLTKESVAEFMITASSNNENCAKDLLEKTINALNKDTEQNGVNANVQGESVAKELKTTADAYGVTPGKLILTKLHALSTDNPSSVDIKEWYGKLAKEIMAAIKEDKKEDKEQNKEQNIARKSGGNADNDEESSNDKTLEKEETNTNGNNSVGQSTSDEKSSSKSSDSVNNSDKENNADKEEKDTDSSGNNGNGNDNSEENNGKEKKDKN